MPDTDAPQPASGPRPGAAGIDPKLLEILVCPVTKQALTYDRAAQELISEKAGLAFPIRGGVPIMLVEEARRLDEDAGSPA
ncbi:Trm112 family protein [Thalassobaculum sp.]|uniref:Trm112 family protein n=1 Tax=Thalassobaculum sp. TaxID=2022740 RepID=UPI003B5CCE35